MTGRGYSIDTSSIITAWNETYRPGSFPSFWRKFGGLIAEGRAFACEEVKRELERKDDVASKWVGEQSNFFVPMDTQRLAVVKDLAKAYPTLAKERLGKSRADGFVIALAEVNGYTVVTAENARGTEKIPNICDARSIPCLSLADLIEEEGWGF